ncbi:MAG: 23S rRNA (uridine(2479)-2'-O)-methyltransferase [Bacteroidetes bacterium ADurb.Bin408]|nr:MAG: 23S rRNA (uridine(2479)-2'-O)-methyltransferase [Bacteroidetes bacterium ADurb.Bin408]
MPLSTQQIKFIKALMQKKQRQENKLFVAEGPKVVGDFMRQRFPIQSLYATATYISENENLLKTQTFPVTEISEKELDRISTLTTPNKVLALCHIPEYEINEQEILNRWSLALDGINDPGNMGTIIRMAHWFNIRYAFCSPDCVEAYNPKTVQAAMGSLAAVKVIYTPMDALLNRMAGKIPIFGTFLNGQNCYDVDAGKNGLLVFGSETHGISPKVASCIDRRISIPPAEGQIPPDSLNAAVSCGIILAEWHRRNRL